MKSIQTKFNGLDIDIELRKRITLLYDYSGSGKTILLKMLTDYLLATDYLLENKIKVQSFDYRNMNDSYEHFSRSCEDKDIILMDNADLYMTRELWDYIEKSDSYFIISMKGIDNINPSVADICYVKFKDNSIKLGRLV